MIKAAFEWAQAKLINEARMSLYEKFLKDCLEGLESTDSEVRVAAAYALGSSGPRAAAALPSLIAHMTDVRGASRSIAYAISEIELREHAGSEAFLKNLLCSNPGLQKLALKCVEYIPVESWPVVAPIVSLIDGDDNWVATNAARAVMPAVHTGFPVRLEKDALDRAVLEYEAGNEDARALLDELGPSVRRALLVIALGSDWPGSADILRDRLHEPGRLERRSAVVGLAWAGQSAFSELADLALESSHEDMRRLAVMALKYCGRIACRVLCHATNDASSEVRYEALKSLKMLEADAVDAAPTIQGLLTDVDEEIRSLAVQSLWRIPINDSTIARELVEMISHDANESVRFEAAETLAEMTQRMPAVSSDLPLQAAFVSLLGRISESVDSPMRRCDFEWPCVEFLWTIHSRLEDSTRSFLLQAGSSVDPILRRLATAGIRHFKDRSNDSIEYLAKSCGDLDERVREYATDALEDNEINIDSVAPIIADSLKSNDGKVRASVADAMGRFNRPLPVFLSALKEALFDPDESVRIYAAQSMAKLAPSELKSLEGLITASRSMDSSIRLLALLTFEKLGPLAISALPAILERSDPNIEHEVNVRDCAARVLTYVKSVESACHPNY